MALSDVVPCDFCDEALNLNFCNDCFVRLCNECKTKHSGISLCKNLVPYKERKLNCTRVCNVHRKDESNILCKTCTLPICSSCLGRHKDHALIVRNELSTRRGKCLETLQYQFEEMKLMEKSSNFTFELCGDSAKEIEKTLKDLLENDDQDNPVFAFELAGRNETECLRRENTQLSKENERYSKAAVIPRPKTTRSDRYRYCREAQYGFRELKHKIGENKFTNKAAGPIAGRIQASLESLLKEDRSDEDGPVFVFELAKKGEKEEKERLSAANVSLESENSNLKKAEKDAEDYINTLTSELKKGEGVISELEKEKKRLESDICQSKETEKEDKNHINTLLLQVKQKDGVNSDLEKKNKWLEEKNTQLEETNKTDRNHYEVLQGELNGQKEIINKLTKENDRLRDELALQTGQRESLEDQCKRKEETIANLQRANKELIVRKEGLTKEMEATMSTVQRLEKEKKELEDRIHQETTIAHLKEELENKKEEYENIERKLNKNLKETESQARENALLREEKEKEKKEKENLEKKLNVKIEELKTKKEECENLEEKLNKNVEEKERLCDDLALETGERKSLEEECQKLIAETETAKANEKELERELKALQGIVQNMTHEIERQTEVIQEYTKAYTNQCTENQNLNLQIDHMRRSLEEQRRTIDKLQKNLSEEKKAKENALNRLTKEMEATQSTVQRLEKEREELEDHMQKMTNEIKRQAEEIQNFARAYENQRTDNYNLNIQISHMSRNLEEQRRTIDKLQKKLSEEIKAKENALKSKEETTDVLQKANAELIREKDRLTKEMEATQSTVQRLEKERRELEDHI